MKANNPYWRGPEFKNHSLDFFRSWERLRLLRGLRAIENLNIETGGWDPIMTHVIVKFFDLKTRKEYECQIDDPKRPQSIESVLKFLENRFMALESYESKTPQQATSTKRESAHNVNQNNKFEAKCKMCNITGHFTSQCKEFEKLSKTERFSAIKERRLCSNCLKSNHKTFECVSENRCKTCNGRHHSLLHNENFIKATKYEQKKTQNNEVVNAHAATNTINVQLATALIQVKSATGEKHMLRALIDQGSQSSFITENAADLLKMPRKHISVQIAGTGAIMQRAKHEININITPRHSSDFQLNANAIILNKVSDCITRASSWENHDHIHG